MKAQLFLSKLAPRAVNVGLTVMVAAVMSACVNYSGIHSDQQQVATPQSYASTESLPSEGGAWPTAGWADQFGDAQLKALLAEALQDSPSIEQAKARVAAASAFAEGARASTLPNAGAKYSYSREQFSGNATVPPPYAGSWQSENTALVTASYELDLWGKNREGLKAALSQLQASKADSEVVALTLNSAIARAYNQLARLYALRDITQEEIAQRQQIERITAGRISGGLDTEVELKTVQADLAASQTTLAGLGGDIVSTRYQLAALLGAGPDRGLTIARPTLGPGDEVRVPDDLPANLVGRRPDLVAARWRVDALTHDVKVAKADFYPDINLSVSAGLDAFGFGRLLTAGSRTANASPAISLPIFDGGALRAQLKGRYAEFDDAIATYNQTLIGALSDVATQLAEIHATDAQLQSAEVAQQASRRADQLALVQYKAGLTNQLTVLNADTTALAADETVVNLRMNRRDRQIALAAALGGGYIDPTAPAASAVAQTDDRRADSPTPLTPVVAAR